MLQMKARKSQKSARRVQPIPLPKVVSPRIQGEKQDQKPGEHLLQRALHETVRRRRVARPNVSALCDRGIGLPKTTVHRRIFTLIVLCIS